VLALIISDVTGDDPTHIASGPCAPDPTTIDDAKAVWRSTRSTSPALSPRARSRSKATNTVIATAHRSLEAAAECVRAQGIHPVILGDTSPARPRSGKVMAALVHEVRNTDPWKPPVA
jgi:hydroxypyruvate reductase